ncbi:ankyrin repeat domain-containing protein 2 [Phtheirospermum japonicum]|uniref:Ankyrin repeat domain-containing protein 2 n=1 Tax=Phtheirospermum japonicum TaxID=374723 RepID=A0A830D2K6_9LAMI|nr:ankyrin repeat domain-containing protein 2 [Phtheirospermum japonicum]
MSQVEENSSSADKRKVGLVADEPNTKRPAIAGLLDPPLTCTFLDDPNIDDLCNRLAENKLLVQMAQQLVKALEDARFEDGNLNDDALKHFALVRQVWRNEHFRTELFDMLTVQERVLTTIIEELSNRVEDEPIEERMSRIKGDNNFKHILDATKPAPIIMRGLLIIIIGYWSYKKLPLKLDEEYAFGFVEDEEKVASVIDTKEIELREKYDIWLMEHGSPIQILEEEPSIMDMANDLKQFRALLKWQNVVWHPFTVLILKIMMAPYVTQENIDSFFCSIVVKYSKRAPVQNEGAVVDVVNNIIKDPEFNPYKDLNEKKDVVGALRIFLSILIVHWIDNDAYKKLHKELVDYAEARRAAAAAAKLAKCKDSIRAEISYTTRFAGDLKDLKEVLDDVYGTAPHGHMFDKLKIRQFEEEIIARLTHYDIAMNVKLKIRQFEKEIIARRMLFEIEMNVISSVVERFLSDC